MNRLAIGFFVVSAISVTSPPYAFAFAPATAEKPRDGIVADWITELSAEDFQTRKTAAEKLTKAGVDAADAVANAANSDDQELPLRCVNILKAMIHSGDAQTKAAAKSALKRLTDSDREFLANLAQKALDSPPPQPAVVGPQFGGGIRINGAMIPGGRNVRINVKTVNGNREISVQIDEKKIEISDANGQDITMTVTEPLVDDNGNTVRKPKTYKAKNLDELRKNHPDAAKLYQQYAGMGFARRLPAQRMPLVPGRAEILKRHLAQLDEILKRREKLVEEGKFPAAVLDRLRQHIDRQRERIAEQIEAAEESERKANAE